MEIYSEKVGCGATFIKKFLAYSQPCALMPFINGSCFLLLAVFKD